MKKRGCVWLLSSPDCRLMQSVSDRVIYTAWNRHEIWFSASVTAASITHHQQVTAVLTVAGNEREQCFFFYTSWLDAKALSRALMFFHTSSGLYGARFVHWGEHARTCWLRWSAWRETFSRENYSTASDSRNVRILFRCFIYEAFTEVCMLLNRDILSHIILLQACMLVSGSLLHTVLLSFCCILAQWISKWDDRL